MSRTDNRLVGLTPVNFRVARYPEVTRIGFKGFLGTLE